MQFNKIQIAFLLFVASVNAYPQPEDIGLATVGEDGAIIAPVQKDYNKFHSLLSVAKTAGKSYTVSGASTRTRASTTRITSAVVKRNADEDGELLTIHPVQKDYSQFYDLLSIAKSNITIITVTDSSTTASSSYSYNEGFKRQAASAKSSSNAGSGLQVSLGLGALSAVVLSLL
ncbi:unnamed protein product [Ambrosiozyma monospora]|uniref:Unnamed protein product n=1 Tax=Ambrosiozyma monospora TaxID=43982 RepID=A0ACB5TFJ6_AMBMO|nr:unnamed protein product [Ambrosiozyma monospora]